uniref:CNOT1_CAF1_bind domain-containing protein n=1 Tax=Bursaphelenchus xylophilus TaxID=6326 RepID=A0A1I7SA08_BURXY
MVHHRVLQLVTHVVKTSNMDNAEQQANVLRQCLSKEADASSWFVTFLVHRVSITDTRAIEVIAQLVHYINCESLWELIVEETVCHAKQIINGLISPPAGGPQRSLRNLGVFLGLLTIASDRPIVLDVLDLKRSLIDAIGEGDEKMARVLPFLVHSLKASARSTLFHPFCSWLSPIFHLLEQLRNEPELKMVFNLEIQSLFTEINENSGPSLLEDSPKPAPHRSTPVEPEHCQPHLPLPTPAQSFSNAFGFHHSVYSNMQAQETQMSSTLYQYYPQDMTNDIYNTPFSPMEPNVPAQFNVNMYNPSPQPSQVQLPPARNMFTRMHQAHSSPALEQFSGQENSFVNNPSYGMITPSQKPGPVPFSKDQKFLWEMVHRLNFEFSQVFKVLEKARSFVIQGMQPLIQKAEELVEQILSRVADSVRQSAITILYRDMVLVEDQVLLSVSFRSTFRVLMYAMYEPRSAIEVLHEKYMDAIRSAIEKATKQSSVTWRLAVTKADMDHVVKEFVSTNSFVIVELISRIIERKAAAMADFEFERLMDERSITLRTNAPRPEMAKFIGQPHSMHVLNASLPHKLRRHAILEAKEHLILESFDSMSNELQSHLHTLFTMIPIQQEEERWLREVPPVVPRNRRDDSAPNFRTSSPDSTMSSEFRHRWV